MRAAVALAVVMLAALTALAASAGAHGDPPPPAAFAPVRLHPIPLRALTQCRQMASRAGFPYLCPLRLPRATVPIRPGVALPRLYAERSIYQDMGGTMYWLSFSYGAPWEPNSPAHWKQHLWRNRPCCFLHFEVRRRPDTSIAVPSGAYPATLAGRRGLFKPAYSHNLACSGDGYKYWCNHVAFLWRERGVPWVATLHYFGPRETRRLLARLIRELRPVRGPRVELVSGYDGAPDPSGPQVVGAAGSDISRVGESRPQREGKRAVRLPFPA